MSSVFIQRQYFNPVKVYVGSGSRAQLVIQLKNIKLLIVTTVRGRNQIENDSTLIDLLKNNTITWLDSIKENPELTDLQQEINQLRMLDVDSIIAFGGGSVIDAAKAIRIGLAIKSEYTLSELLENPVLHKDIKQVSLFSVPTTSGTGSEVTPFATIWHHKVYKKLSLFGDNIFPTVAIVDAELTEKLPVNITISTGLDAINQAAESIWNKNANGITLALATRSLQLGLRALPLLAKSKGGQLEREQMSEASLLAGLAISHTRTALCHSISYPLTARFGVPHGLACAFTMPEVCKLNIRVDDGRFAILAKSLTGKDDARELYNIFFKLNKFLGVADLVKAYIDCFDKLAMIENEMYSPSRAENSLVDFNDIDLNEILKKSWM